jgi:hypothetical protein
MYSDGRCRIEVSDRGPGIPDGHLDRVFDRFFTYRPDNVADRGQPRVLGCRSSGRLFRDTAEPSPRGIARAAGPCSRFDCRWRGQDGDLLSEGLPPEDLPPNRLRQGYGGPPELRRRRKAEATPSRTAGKPALAYSRRRSAGAVSSRRRHFRPLSRCEHSVFYQSRARSAAADATGVILRAPVSPC